ncbi:MAG: hypothetical protein CVV47_02430 [Spirochaetae bacterium HGW-Spirochaetae-3]|jgi:hypothetical protein|nr:MAG: hypothetical protein CVV47_02430 [Spirochaetae bacterium HGW-Spirochaetae-3]
MKNSKKLSATLAAALLCAGAAWGQDSWGDDGAWGDESAPSVGISGSASMAGRFYTADDDEAITALPSFQLDLSYAGASSELAATLLLDEETLGENPEDVLAELRFGAFIGDFGIEAGKMKAVWGKGDKLHVVDLFNANDYTDFLFPDYIDRRLGEEMVRVTWNAPSGGRIEAIWTPTMTADRVPLSGRWTPASATSLVAAATSYVSNLAATASTTAYATTYTAIQADGTWNPAAAAAADAASLAAAQAVLSEFGDASDLLPDTSTLDYGQYGVGYTTTMGGVDLGLLYYLGHYKTPSVTVGYGVNGLGRTVVTSLSIAYDRFQSFGAEAAMAVGPLNLRGEAAYYLGADRDGDDPAVKNDSVNWVAGFDIGLPLGELNLNVQTIGRYVMGNDGIAGASDVDYDSDGVYTNDKIVVSLSDSFAHEKVQPKIDATWDIERGDVVLMPKLTIAVRDDMNVELYGAAFLCDDDGEFAAYEDNDFVGLKLDYSF